MYVELLTHKTLKGERNCNICFNDIQYNRVSELLKEAQERNIKLTCVEGKHCKCLGEMYRSDGNLTYGAMVCECCIEQKLCRELSRSESNE